MNGIFFTPSVFCYNYFGVFGEPWGLYVYFITGHLTEFSLQLEGLLALVVFLECLISVSFCGSSFLQGCCRKGEVTDPPHSQPSCHSLPGERDTSSTMSKRSGIHLQAKYFFEKELALRQLVFWSRVTECTSYRVKNTQPLKPSLSSEPSLETVAFLTPWTRRKMCA